MSLPYGKPSWSDGDFTVAKPTGLPVFSSPIPLNTAPYVLNQDFIQYLNNYLLDHTQGVHALGTPHVDYPTYYLVKEGELRDQMGGVVRWTRTYAQIPASYNLPETFPYSFIGTLIQVGVGGGATVNITRTRQLWTVDSRVQYDYFLVPSTGVTDPITGSTHNLTVPGDIDQIQQMVYVTQRYFPGPSTGALLGGITLPVDILNPVGSSSPTWPPSSSLAPRTGGILTYEDMVSDALVNGWNAAVTKVFLHPTNTLSTTATGLLTSGHMAGTVIVSPDSDPLLPAGSVSVLGGQIPAEPSRLDLWMGSIFVRRTRYVLADGAHK
jgi:hypothetical protein